MTKLLTSPLRTTAALLSGAALCFTSCSKAPDTASTDNKGSGGGKKLTSVGVTVGDLGNPFFVLIGKAAQDKSKALAGDGCKVTLVSSNYDVNTQSTQIDNFIAAGVQLIILGAADSKGIAPAVKRAKDAGITVVAVDVGAEGGVDATVTSDNKQAGTEAAKYIVDRIKGQGNVIIVNGPPVSSVQDRANGALEIFKQNSGIKVLSQDQNAGGSRDGGLRIMTDLLSANPKVDAVFAINDPPGIGCDLAAKQANRKEFFIVGVDASADGEVALKDTSSLFVATPAQDPYAMTEKAVEIGFNIITKGEKPSEALSLIPVKLITKENVGSYKGWTSR